MVGEVRVEGKSAMGKDRPNFRKEGIKRGTLFLKVTRKNIAFGEEKGG